MFRHTRPDSHKAIATRSSKASFGQRHLPPQQVVSCETPRDGTENLRRKFATKSSHLSASRRLTSNDLDTEFSPATALQNMKALEGIKQSKQLAGLSRQETQTVWGIGGIMYDIAMMMMMVMMMMTMMMVYLMVFRCICVCSVYGTVPDTNMSLCQISFLSL